MVKFVVQHGLIAVCHLPGSSGALADHFDHGPPVQPGFFGKMQRLRQALHHTGDGNLVAHLGHLARATVANPAANLGINLHHGERAIKGALIATAHDGQLGVFRARLSTRDRRIHK